MLGVHLLIGGHLNYSAESGWEDGFTGRLLMNKVALDSQVYAKTT